MPGPVTSLATSLALIPTAPLHGEEPIHCAYGQEFLTIGAGNQDAERCAERENAREH